MTLGNHGDHPRVACRTAPTHRPARGRCAHAASSHGGCPPPDAAEEISIVLGALAYHTRLRRRRRLLPPPAPSPCHSQSGRPPTQAPGAVAPAGGPAYAATQGCSHIRYGQYSCSRTQAWIFAYPCSTVHPSPLDPGLPCLACQPWPLNLVPRWVVSEDDRHFPRRHAALRQSRPS